MNAQTFIMRMNQLGRNKLNADDIPVVQAILDMIMTPRFELDDKIFIGGAEETITEINYTYKLTCSDSNNYEETELLPAIDVEGFQDWCRKHGLRFSDSEYKAYLDLKGLAIDQLDGSTLHVSALQIMHASRKWLDATDAN